MYTYYHTAAMLHAIFSVREEGGDISTQTREQQVANYVGPTLAELGLAQWMATHGGMVTKCSFSPSLSLPPPSLSSFSPRHTITCCAKLHKHPFLTANCNNVSYIGL